MGLEPSNWTTWEWLFVSCLVLAFVYIVVRIATHAYYKSKHEYLSNLQKLASAAYTKKFKGVDDEK